jgi:hypothetical protein
MSNRFRAIVLSPLYLNKRAFEQIHSLVFGIHIGKAIKVGGVIIYTITYYILIISFLETNK